MKKKVKTEKRTCRERKKLLNGRTTKNKYQKNAKKLKPKRNSSNLLDKFFELSNWPQRLEQVSHLDESRSSFFIN